MRSFIHSLIFLLCTASTSAAQTPTVSTVSPPSWWTKSTNNPVRLLIQGTNLKDAQVQVAGPGLRVVGSPRSNERGTYLFVDVAIAPNARAGQRSLTIRTPMGTAHARFDILPNLAQAGRFQGFSPSDVLYLI